MKQQFNQIKGNIAKRSTACHRSTTVVPGFFFLYLVPVVSRVVQVVQLLAFSVGFTTLKTQLLRTIAQFLSAHLRRMFFQFLC